MTYEIFLAQKKRNTIHSGFNVDYSEMNINMFDFQKFIVKRALEAGKYAIFADCGLGKTLMQLEWARLVNEHTNKPVLIVAPLAVAGQTIKEGEKFGISVARGDGDIQIINYEQLESIDCSIYGGVVIDESSILKNFEGAYRNLIIESFAKTPYKLACTATPAPNDPMELGNHAEFLNVMGRTQMLSMYFVHDGGETAKWRIKGHAYDKFYNWVSSWSVMLTNPSDLGFDGTKYHLPELKFIEEQIKTPQRDGSLFNSISISATNFNQELRITKVERMDKVAEIVNNSKENFIVWVKQNEEADLAKSLIPDAFEVRGDDDPQKKEDRLLGFADDKFRVLLTKTKIAQYGLNYQNCHNQVFASLDFSFEGLYQAIRRSYRFGQTKPVNIYLITTDTMENVVTAIARKQRQFEEMQHKMTKNINHEN